MAGQGQDTYLIDPLLLLYDIRGQPESAWGSRSIISIQKVQYFDTGIVSEILIKEGDYIKQGQALMKIDTTRFQATFEDLTRASIKTIDDLEKKTRTKKK